MSDAAKIMNTEPLLRVEHLKKYYEIPSKKLFDRSVRYLKAADDVSFDIGRGETFALVGESGCGKTTVGKTILRFHEPTGGDAYFKGENIFQLKKEDFLKRRQKMQMIFQDPFSSLNPRMTIYDSVADVMKIHKLYSGDALDKRVYELLGMVGLPSWLAKRYPHEFSGGQLQRACIARALALDPDFIVCDEPVSALDVSIQSQVLNLLGDIQKEVGVSYLFISHGLPAVRYISHRIGVMYMGKLVEVSESNELFHNPMHPYTQALVAAVPIPNPDLKKERKLLEGEVTSPIDPPDGCRFCSRCPYVTDRCRTETPELKDMGGGHMVACHCLAGQ